MLSKSGCKSLLRHLPLELKMTLRSNNTVASRPLAFGLGVFLFTERWHCLAEDLAG